MALDISFSRLLLSVPGSVLRLSSLNLDRSSTMAQCMQSFKDHLLAALTIRTTRVPNEVEAAPVAQTRLPTSLPGSTLCGKSLGVVQVLTFKHQLDEAIQMPFPMPAFQFAGAVDDVVMR